ncbi:MAG TPA: TIGR03435 family protein [Bryobacteraceae bacterium]
MRIVIAIIVVAAAQGSFAQPRPRPEFEAAAIKLNKSCSMGARSGGMASPGRITLECAELRDLILTAYEIYGGNANPTSFRMQVLGGPAWIDSDRYDFTLKAEGNASVPQMYGPMLQALLKNRFRLRVHRETREAPVFLLTVAKGGARLEAAKEGACLPVCGSVKADPLGRVDMFGVTMADLATQLGMRLDRDVIDRTGLTGKFDVHLEVSPGELAARHVAGNSVSSADSQPAADLSGPSIFTALEQQLGLKLEPAKGQVTVLVIDSILRPSAN